MFFERFFILYNIKVYISDKNLSKEQTDIRKKRSLRSWKITFCVISQSILTVLFNLRVLIAMLLMDIIPVVVIFSFRVPTCILYYFLIIFFLSYKVFHMACPSCTIYIQIITFSVYFPSMFALENVVYEYNLPIHAP